MLQLFHKFLVLRTGRVERRPDPTRFKRIGSNADPIRPVSNGSGPMLIRVGPGLATTQVNQLYCDDIVNNVANADYHIA